MSDVTQLLLQIEEGDRKSADQLLPIVYEELRRLAAARMNAEKPGQTIQPTALVHEAFMRLVDPQKVARWDSRGHFFAAAAEAMRRILVDRYRERVTKKRGGEFRRVDLENADLGQTDDALDLIALNDALEKLGEIDPPAAEIAKLRLFAGMSVDEVSQALGRSRSSAYRQWTYAQAWLQSQLNADGC